MTGITLDSWKVYPSRRTPPRRLHGFLNTTAAVRGFENAVRVLDRVIVAEMQGSGERSSAISVAADNAFDAGAVIIAANGNNGPGANTVNVPAIAHKVIGVGDFDVQRHPGREPEPRPAPDDRFKPDIQAPTNTETASTASDTARQSVQRHEWRDAIRRRCGRAPAELAARTDRVHRPGPGLRPAHPVGPATVPVRQHRGRGGPIELPTNGWAWWGKVSVTNGQTIDIPITISRERANTFDAALWWPEGGFRILGFEIDFHSDIDLSLIDPAGSIRASSISINSVFERASVAGRVAAGTWRLRIRGFRVPLFPPTVYWAAHVRTS